MSSEWVYDLKKGGSLILRLFHLLFHDPTSIELESILTSLNLTIKKWKERDHVYSILKYETGKLKCDELESIGLFRSVVLDQHGKILAFSPAKCILAGSSHENIRVEEFVEGTMINVFYHRPNGQEDGACWEISTKSSVGGKVVFHSLGMNANSETDSEKKTFRRMFLECMNDSNLEFDALDKSKSYSFVMQHPNNHIVGEINTRSLYLIAVYNIDNENLQIVEEPRENHLKMINENQKTLVKLPRVYDKELNEVKSQYASLNSSHDFPGIVCRDLKTGSRFKYRNPNYEFLRNLHGFEPKLLFQYLSLRKQTKIEMYLKANPKHSEKFKLFRDNLFSHTSQLFQNYIECYIQKKKELKYYPPQFKTHMFKLHEHYINVLRPLKKHITMKETIFYVNSLHPSQQLYFIMYIAHKQNVSPDSKKSTTN